MDEEGEIMTLESYLARLESFNQKYSIDRIKSAFMLAESSHEGQKRKSGEAYIIHPIEVSLILAELGMDEDTIVGALLHDVVEDTEISLDDIEEQFGKDIAIIVDGVTKLTKTHFQTKKEQQVENLRKMFLAMGNDVRIILIKLADRLHNMRTLNYMSEEKKKEKAQETIDIYAPIAHRLGISKFKWELEDLALKYLYPVDYANLVKMVNKKRTERETVISSYIKEIESEVGQLHVDCEIYGRPKSFYSIFRKMKYQHKNFDEIYDLTAIRILVDSVKECYTVLGVVHTIWKPIPGRFKDYIAMPKPNMYQSLHTTVMGKGEPFEIQIRTHEMHKIAELGIAAHWKYKEGVEKTGEDIENKFAWIRQIMEWQSDTQDPNEFMDALKLDLFSNEVLVFTPNGEVVDLPVGSTPIDFAYKIHSEVGNHCTGAKVDGRIVPLTYQLKTGQRVEVITSKNNQGPSRDWLKFVKSAGAKSKIKQFFKKERRDENVEKGKDMLSAEVRKLNLPNKDILNDEFLKEIMQRLSVKTLEDLYAAIGYGGIQTGQVIPKIREHYRDLYQPKEAEVPQSNEHVYKREHKPTSHQSGVVVKGIDNLLIRFARCCNPVPGDEIIGYVTRGRGVTIHRSDCPNFEKSEDGLNRFIEVEWQGHQKKSYLAEIQVVAPDRRGLLGEITILLSDTDLVVSGINAKIDKNGVAIINLTVEVNDANQLNKLKQKLRNLRDVIEVKRVTS